MNIPVILGTGGYLPPRIVTNHELSTRLDTSDEWIVSRTGIKQRHIADDTQMTSDLAYEAGKEALARAGVAPAEVDLLIVATSTPDDTIPATATKVQHKLGIPGGAAMDLNAACSGFVYGMHLANNLIRSGAAETILIIGAEVFSRVVDWSDRSTCILFGDGAGAAVVCAEADSNRGILYSRIYSDGQYASILGTNGGVASTKTAGTLFMQGKEVFRHAVAKMGDCVVEGLGELGLTTKDIDWLVPHQANARILKAMAEKFEIPQERVLQSVATHANTSAASIPLALHEAVVAGKVQPEQLVVMTALGAGLTWGSCIIRW